MKFKQATDALLGSVTLEDLAKRMGVSVQTLRQARVAEGSKAHRSPPVGWEDAVRRTATERQQYFKQLAEKL